jgi:hypothetical protein
LDALAAGLFHNPGRLQATDSARCDHLETTCRDKFDNLVNHPGWSRLPGRNPFVGRID